MAFLAAAERRAGRARSNTDGYPPWWKRILPPRLRRWLPPLLVVAGAVAYAIYMSVFTLRMHGRFQTYNFDLGQYDNLFWNLLHGHPLRMSPLGLDQQLDGPAEPRRPLGLLLHPDLCAEAGRDDAARAAVVHAGPGGDPDLSLRGPPAAARATPALIALAYLMYPPMHGMQFYDFHMQPMASTFVLFVIDFVDARRYWLCALAFAIAITCREDISVGLAILGAFLMLSGYRLLPGLVIAIVATRLLRRCCASSSCPASAAGDSRTSTRICFRRARPTSAASSPRWSATRCSRWSRC